MKSQEAAFIRKIDCAFPYTDFDMAEKLIEEACAISANAAFMVLFELSNPGKGATYSLAQIRSLLTIWQGKISHPLRDIVLSLVEKKLDLENISNDEIVSAMIRCAEQQGSLMALNTVYNCLPEAAEDIDALYESLASRFLKR